MASLLVPTGRIAGSAGTHSGPRRPPPEASDGGDSCAAMRHVSRDRSYISCRTSSETLRPSITDASFQRRIPSASTRTRSICCELTPWLQIVATVQNATSTRWYGLNPAPVVLSGRPLRVSSVGATHRSTSQRLRAPPGCTRTISRSSSRVGLRCGRRLQVASIPCFGRALGGVSRGRRMRILRTHEHRQHPPADRRHIGRRGHDAGIT